jgi:hypothetical protein
MEPHLVYIYIYIHLKLELHLVKYHDMCGVDAARD